MLIVMIIPTKGDQSQATWIATFVWSMAEETKQ